MEENNGKEVKACYFDFVEKKVKEKMFQLTLTNITIAMKLSKGNKREVLILIEEFRSLEDIDDRGYTICFCSSVYCPKNGGNDRILC